MSATMMESTTHFSLVNGPGRDRLYGAVDAKKPVQFSLGNGSQFAALITSVELDPNVGEMSNDKKDYQLIVEGTIDGRAFVAHYNAHTRAGNLEFLDA